jgi:hypothetical protein
MSEVAGFDDTKKGLTMGGARYSFTEHSNIGAITQYAWNLWNTVYAEANFRRKLGDQVGILLSGQYTDQRSTGDELDGDFDTYVFGGKAALSYRGAILSLAFSSVDTGSDIRNPFGGYPGYLSLMIEDFDRAGEDAWLVGLSYNFSSLGMEGLSAFANFAQGDTPNTGTAASPDQEEFDLTVDYRFKKGLLKGLWLRFRCAFLDQHGLDAQDVQNYRFILNYEIPVL